jgi:hypothetical protein
LVANWIAEHTKAGVLPHEFGVFVRSTAQLERARVAVKASGHAFKILDEHVETTTGHISISTMHLAKGLEFRAVAVMACDDEIIPLQERIETVGDDADLQEVYDTSDSCSTLPVPAPGIIWLFPESSRYPNSWTISRRAIAQRRAQVESVREGSGERGLQPSYSRPLLAPR